MIDFNLNVLLEADDDLSLADEPINSSDDNEPELEDDDGEEISLADEPINDSEEESNDMEDELVSNTDELDDSENNGTDDTATEEESDDNDNDQEVTKEMKIFLFKKIHELYSSINDVILKAEKITNKSYFSDSYTLNINGLITLKEKIITYMKMKAETSSYYDNLNFFETCKSSTMYMVNNLVNIMNKVDNSDS